MPTGYLAALIAHDPEALPLADKARFTENTVEKPPGEGLWKTASGLGGFRQDILDVRQRVAGTHVVVQENGAPVLIKARLKLAGGKISEIDTTVVRNQTEGMIFRPEELKTSSAAMNLTPERSQFNTRDEMIQLALLYPAGLKVGSFVKVDAKFTPDAYRLEKVRLWQDRSVRLCPAAPTSKNRPCRPWRDCGASRRRGCHWP
jgi:hypothetical protein